MLKRTAFILIMLLTAILAACGGPTEEPTEDLSGYQAVGFPVSGGMAVENANAKSVEITHQDRDTTITFNFVTGSQLSGETEEGAAGGVPLYKVSLLARPMRLVIEFDHLSYWDYDHYLDIVDDELLYGHFQTLLTADGRVLVYFQLRQNAVMTVSDQGASLSIVLHTTEDQEPTTAYYVAANAYEDFLLHKSFRIVYCAPSGHFPAEHLVGPLKSAGFLDDTIDGGIRKPVCGKLLDRGLNNLFSLLRS